LTLSIQIRTVSQMIRLVVVSDIHHAGPLERARGGRIAEDRSALWQRLLLRLHRRFLWLDNPFAHNHLLDGFLDRAGTPDWVIANGDYSCDSAYLGLSDPAAYESAALCLQRLRDRFSGRLLAIMGDHELGKRSMAGGFGGLRLASWHRTRSDLGVPPFWTQELGRYVLMGVTSTVLALPVYQGEALPEELEAWRELRRAHLAEIAAAFGRLRSDQRVILFCHDPSALPFLWRETAVREHVAQIEQTVVGHLHSPLILWQSRLLAGMPRLTFLGSTAERLSSALQEAGHWRHFRVRLCPSLTGIQLRQDGGFFRVLLDPEAREPARFTFQPLPWPEWVVG
jgi:hypothetical protein